MARDYAKSDRLGLARYVESGVINKLPIELSRYELLQQPDGLCKIVEQIYDALNAKEIRYAPVPHNEFEQLQTIRTADEIIDGQREGNCLDLALLFCGACLGYELLPVIIMLEGHALVAVSVKNDLNEWNSPARAMGQKLMEGPLTDAAALRRLVESGEYVAVECTGFAQVLKMPGQMPEATGRTPKGVMTFRRAVEAGLQQLSVSQRPFQFALDIASTHLGLKIAPYPTNIVNIIGDNVTVINGSGPTAQLTKKTPPYKFLAPFAYRDAPLFKGREAHAAKVLKTMEGQQVVVLWGKAGIGKTSLINAALQPKLAQRGEHSKAVYLNTYNNPLGVLRKHLANIVSPSDTPDAETRAPSKWLAAMARTVSSKSNHPLVLLLDQFEQLFRDSTPVETRNAFIRELVETLDDTTASEFSLLIAVDESDINHVLVLQSSTRRHQLLAAHIMLPPLTRAEARRAILGPLEEVGTPDLLEEVLVDGALLPDLVNMGDGDFTQRDAAGANAGNKEECVYPPYLQIVCHSLYMLAQGLSGNKITAAAYKAEQGAEGIFARHLVLSLAMLFNEEEDRECAKHFLVKLTEPEIKGWVTANGLGVECAPRPDGLDVFETLADAGLLSARTVNRRREYALPNPAVLKAARNLLGAEAQKPYVARDEVEQLYASWLLLNDDSATLASVEQLKFLERFASSLPLDPVRALLLLRSAVARLEPTRPWLDRLRQSVGGSVLINRLADASLRKDDPPSSEITNAKLLLGMVRRTGPEESEAEGLFETVAHAAVSHESPTVRETAVVGLMAIGNNNAVGQVDAALASLEGLRGRLRRVELRSAMLEADPSMKQHRTSLDWFERKMVFLWVLRRKAYQGRVRLLRLTAGGALGAGLALGLLGALIAKTIGDSAAIEFTNKMLYGSIFGAFISFGLAMLKPLSLTRRGEGDDASPATNPQFRAAYFLCAALFGLAHLLIYYINSSSSAPISQVAFVLGMGFVAGAGVSWAVAPDLNADGSIKARWNVKYIGGAALVFLLIQVIFILTSGSTDRTPHLVVVNSGQYYFSNLSTGIGKAINTYFYGGRSVAEVPDHVVPLAFNYVAAVDSALTGLAVAVGIKLGLSLAGKSLRP